MARVAKELGFTTMSLYRYVTSKDELLQLMWNASAQGAENLVLEGDGWRERLRNWAMVQREMLDRHPWITQMPMAAPPLAPNSLTFVERGLETLDDTGIWQTPTSCASSASSAPTPSVRPEWPTTRHVPRRTRAAGGEGERAAMDLRRPAPRARRRAELPEAAPDRLVRRVLSHDTSAAEEQRAYLFGLDLILNGVQALIDKTGRRKR